jgi:hypothetical protein
MAFLLVLTSRPIRKILVFGTGECLVIGGPIDKNILIALHRITGSSFEFGY